MSLRNVVLAYCDATAGGMQQYKVLLWEFILGTGCKFALPQDVVDYGFSIVQHDAEIETYETFLDECE